MASYYKLRTPSRSDKRLLYIVDTPSDYRLVWKYGRELYYRDYHEQMPSGYERDSLDEITKVEADALLAGANLRLLAGRDPGSMDAVAAPQDTPPPGFFGRFLRRYGKTISWVFIIVVAACWIWLLFIHQPERDTNAPPVPAEITKAIESAETQASMPGGHLEVSFYQLHEDMDKLELPYVAFVCYVLASQVGTEPDTMLAEGSSWAILADSETGDDAVLLEWNPAEIEPKEGEIWVLWGFAFSAGKSGWNIPGVKVYTGDKVGEGPFWNWTTPTTSANMTTSAPQVEKAKFSDAWQALTKIEAATWAGVEVASF